MRDSCSSSSSSLSCNSSSSQLHLAAFRVRLAGSEATTAGEGSSGGVEVDGIGAIGDGFAGDGAVGSSSPGSGGGIGPAAEAIWAHLGRHQQHCHWLVRWRSRVEGSGGRR
jgi:hypothetical protein